MTPFLWGILVGAFSATAAGGILLLWALQKARRLERRTARAERLAELGTLTGGLAHEIKNPLSTLGLNLQLLREDLEQRAVHLRAGGNPEEAARVDRMVRRLTSVSGEATRLREILDDFLRYAGRLELEPQPTDLRQLAEELIDFLAPQAHVARMRLNVEAEPDMPHVPVDQRLIKQALLNLLLNALQHTPEGGEVTLRIDAPRPTRPGRRVVQVSVADTGSGIDPGEQQRVFEPYFSRRKGGTGLGLPMTRRIVQAHGGEIHLESAPGKGSRFVIVLPLSAEGRRTSGTGGESAPVAPVPRRA